MKNIFRTFSFINKNSIYLLLYALPPVLLISVGFDMSQSLSVPQAESMFFAMHKSLSILYGGNILTRLLVFVLFVLCAALSVSFCERRMRIGVASLGKPIKQLNETLIVTLSAMALVLVGYEIMAVLASGVLHLFSKAALGVRQVATAVITLVFYLVLFLYATLFIMWPAYTLESGYSLSEGLGAGIKAISSRFFRVYFEALFPFLVTVPIMLCSELFFSWEITKYLIYALGFLVQTMYICVYPMVLYFDISGRERADLNTLIPYGKQ